MSRKNHQDGSKHLIRIVQHMGRVGQYVNAISEEEYCEKGLCFDGINKQIDLIGEQVAKLFESKDNIVHHFPDVPWAQLRGLRNRIAHDYFSIDPVVVWRFLTTELDAVEKQVRNILLKRYGVVEVPEYAEHNKP